MNRLDEETQYALNQSSGRHSQQLKIAGLYRANELQQQRQLLPQTLEIISINGGGIRAYWYLAELNE